MRQVQPGHRNEPRSVGRGSPGHQRTPEPAAAADALDLPAIGRLVWSELPILAVIDLLFTLGVAVVAVVAMTVAALAPVVAAVLIGPVWLGGTAICNRTLDGDGVALRDVPVEVGRRAVTGMRIALVPGVVATLLIGSVTIQAAGGGSRTWMMLPIAVDSLVLTVVAFGCLMAFPLAVLSDLSGVGRWRTALVLAGRYPLMSAGLLAFGVLLLVSIRLVGPVVLLAAAGPFCLLVTATARSVVTIPGADAVPRRQDR